MMQSKLDEAVKTILREGGYVYKREWQRDGESHEVGYFQDRYQMIMMEREEFEKFVLELRHAIYDLVEHRKDTIAMDDDLQHCNEMLDDLKDLTVPLKTVQK